jgi:ankyrin repeat protein
MFHLVKHWNRIILVVNVIIFSLSAFASAEPLNGAAKDGDLDEAKRLIEEGANIEAKDVSGSTPLYNALDQGNKEIVKFLILKGANVNAVMINGKTPLAQAEMSGVKDTVELLIKHGGHK